MTSVDEAIAELFQDSAAQVVTHQQLTQRLSALAELASRCISPHDVGIALLTEIGDEEKVKVFLQRQSEYLNNAFTNWYAAARLAANEGRNLK